MIPIYPEKFTPLITVRPHPMDCFFTTDCGCNWCPGWVAADVTLPLAAHSNKFCLVFDSLGFTHWIPANKIKYRGECPKFEFAYYQKFDWQKWRQFPEVNDFFIPRAENVWKESDRLAITEQFEF